jgi:hypothetical protein
MKRIYLLMLAVGATAVTASAQRAVDLSIRHFYKLGNSTSLPTTSQEITNGTHILFDGDEQYKFQFGYIIKNNATVPKDSVMKSDTLFFRTFLDGGIFQTVAGPGLYIPVGASTGMLGVDGWPDAVKPGPAFNNISQPLPTRLCDSVWIKSPTGSPNPAVEANPSNDTTCHDVIIDGWQTGINDFDVDAEGNGLLVYPNPAVSRDINIMYNFGANTSKAVVTIVDVTGKVVYNKVIGTDLKGTQNIALQMGNINPGMYSVRLATDDKTTVEKIFVK